MGGNAGDWARGFSVSDAYSRPLLSTTFFPGFEVPALERWTPLAFITASS